MSLPTPDINTTPAAPYNTPPALIAFTIAILVLCFVAFSIIYLCKYYFVSVIHTWAFQRTASGTLNRVSPNRSPPRGLDPSLLQVFPTFLYSSVKDLRKEKYSLECAICLLEFEDDSMLRLLTFCCHVFHQECIDLWLSSHKTCPVCRTELDSPTEQMRKSCECHHVEGSMVSLTSDHDISINVREGEGDGVSAGDQRQEQEHEHEHEHERYCNHPVSVSISPQQEQEENFITRSHSTGHSIVMIRGGGGEEEKDYDKYTLRLPEHVIRSGGHNYTRSCKSYQEITRPAPCCNRGFVTQKS
ncbi:RING-H2 finger protein ATL29-like [Gastrolobium bilobum]|uniref:RING-H2 finger protein ATL29-like n=1 Tax=Gastrolobium bilobum TaxID=150636 RepID=UPI002AB20DFA|nr:RING-H2 finger protein ATL29-like [Gastrolobium bilobum]